MTLKPTMSPSASFRSHSTATEYSEAEGADEQTKDERRRFWKGHRRGESKATPTASQTDLHGSVPGGDKSMSSFGSSTGFGGGRRSLQYDSHQSSEVSMPAGADGKEHSERKSPFEWFQKKRQEHKDRADKKYRAKSPPASTTDLISPPGTVRPRDDLAVRGRSMDVPRPTASQDSSDVTPTGTSPKPLVMASPPPKASVEGTAISAVPNSEIQPVTESAPASTNPQAATGTAAGQTGGSDKPASHPSSQPLV